MSGEQAEDKILSYTPFGESEEIKLSAGMVRKYFATPTKAGKMPTDKDLMGFLMLCKARGLNPWVGDAYLVGFDAKDGPQFSLITAVQALFKRAETHPQFAGIESGVIVQADNKPVYRQGDIVFSGEHLLGGWARVYRRDRDVPYYDAIDVKTRDKGFGNWKSDRAGMIAKCAESSVLRQAFPTQNGGLFTRDEAGLMLEGEFREPQKVRAGNRTEALRQRLLEQQPEEQSFAEQVDAPRDEEAVTIQPGGPQGESSADADRAAGGDEIAF